MDGIGTDLIHHLVDQSDVGESTSGHDFIVTSSSTVGVEVLVLDTTFVEVSSGRRVLGNGTGGGDMISSDRVTQVQQAVSTLDAFDLLGNEFGGFEEGRVVDVSGVRLPVVDLLVRGLQGIPSSSTLRDLLIDVDEHFRLEVVVDSALSGSSSGPDVLQEDGLTILVVTKGFLFKINVDGTSQSVSND